MTKQLRYSTVILVCLFVLVMFSGCGASGIKAVQGTQISKRQAETLTLEKQSNSIYTIDLPKGWTIETVGQYTTFGFRAYDPARPERQIFFYCKMEPFLKSSSAKSEYRGMANLVGQYDAYGYHTMADALVLNNTTTDYFFSIFNDYTAYAQKYGISHNFAKLSNLKVYEKFNSETQKIPNCLDNSIIRAAFTSANNVACEGLFAAQINNKISYPSPATGRDLGFYCAYNIMGISAEAGEFSNLQDTLIKSLSSFSFTQEYVNQAVKYVQEQTEAILAQGRMMQGVYDSYNAAWRARQTTYDVLSEKRSDANLGYERLYDTQTGEIYRAETGLYDEYYKDSRLKKIEDNDYDRYLKNIDYYIYK